MRNVLLVVAVLSLVSCGGGGHDDPEGQVCEGPRLAPEPGLTRDYALDYEGWYDGEGTVTLWFDDVKTASASVQISRTGVNQILLHELCGGPGVPGVVDAYGATFDCYACPFWVSTSSCRFEGLVDMRGGASLSSSGELRFEFGGESQECDSWFRTRVAFHGLRRAASASPDEEIGAMPMSALLERAAARLPQ